MKKVGITNPELVNLIHYLQKQSRVNKSKIWKLVAHYLSRSKRRRIAVNLSNINRHTKKDETVIIPGKVLGVGNIDHPLNIAAFTFSEQARLKILENKGKCMTIPELIQQNPKGSGIKIIR